MSYQGHCNCGSIRITLPEQPPSTIVCHCNCCKQSGGGGFSVNYLVDEKTMIIDDANVVLKSYDDNKSDSGNIAKRHFCSNCGSPLFTKTPKLPGKAFLKATLFDTVSPPTAEVFGEKQYTWVTIQKANQNQA